MRAKGTAAGRGAMAADLAELSAALKAAAPRDAAVAAAMEGQLRLVDSWMRVRSLLSKRMFGSVDHWSRFEMQ